MGLIAAGVLGAGMALGGTAMAADAAGDSKDALERLAKTPKTDYKGIQLDTIAGNQAAVPKAAALANSINQANLQQRQQLLNSAIPQFGQIRDKSSADLLSLLSGSVPQDVQDLLQRSSAAKALGGGYAGSGMHSNLLSRDLGLTSLDMIGKGMGYMPSYLTSLYNVAAPPQFDLSSMLLNPSSTVNLMSNERAQNMGVGEKAALAPSSGQVWGQGLEQMGGSLMGAGMSGGISSGGLSFGNFGKSSATGDDMASLFGPDSEMAKMQNAYR